VRGGPPASPPSAAEAASAKPRARGRPRKVQPSGPPSTQLPADFIAQRQAANPRDAPELGGNVEYP
jgi:hypothetical protein